MSLLHINYTSQSLGSQSGMQVILPVEGKPFRVLYLLHGASGDYSDWVRLSNIQLYAEERGLMVVMPSGANSFYVDARGYHANYEQHILECVRFIDNTFSTIDSPGARGIGGLSMGGYGAMKLGLKYPTLFGSLTSHSGALDVAAFFQQDTGRPIHEIFGATLPAEEDCFALAARPGAKPAIYFDCGDEDFLLEHNRRFAAHLRQLGLPHEYHEHPGGHTWRYWDQHVQEALDFHCRHFAPLEQAAPANG